MISFVLQLISLAGLHTNATITTELSRAFKDEGMLAYVRLVQSREKELGVDVLTHQKWSGAAYMDGILGSIQSGSSSSKSMGEGNTETGMLDPCKTDLYWLTTRQGSKQFEDDVRSKIVVYLYALEARRYQSISIRSVSFSIQTEYLYNIIIST